MAVTAIPSMIGTMLGFLLEADPGAASMGMAFALLVAISTFGVALLWSRSR